MMFSTNPFAQPANSSIHDFTPSDSFLDNEKDDLYINPTNLDNPFVSGDWCLYPYSPSPATDKSTTSNQDSAGIEGLGLEQYSDEHNHVLGSEVSLSPQKKKKTYKKDHHSKIHTAQGPRDRRVRLSIDVARKFFCLQDFLGFDKASKTLDWLFKESKIPIDELVQGMKNYSSSTVSDESQEVFLEILKEDDQQDKGQKKNLPARSADIKGKKITRKHRSEVPVSQSRAEARARARERTKEKLHTKKLDHEANEVHGDFYNSPGSPYLNLQSSLWTAIESQNDYIDKFGESLVEENFSMSSSSMFYGYQQNNHSVSNESSSNFAIVPEQ